MNALLIDPPRIARIVGLDADPVRRNLLITQSYHDLATALSMVLGQDNANWCHFACWASRTAGTFIRSEQIPGLFRSLVLASGGYREAAGLPDIEALPADDRVTLGELIGRIAAVISTSIMEGNLAVYSELAPVFSEMIGHLPAADQPQAARLASVLSLLRAGDTAAGGQQLLREAVANYFLAHETPDPTARAQRILLANAQVGLHEQIRLQPYIQHALAALFEESIDALHHNLAARTRRRLFTALLRLMLHPLEERLQARWEALATDIFMTLRLRDETLRLGRPLPPPPGQPMYPDALREIGHAPLRHLLMRYDALTMRRRDIAARDWGQLEDRMCYILNLFRSRQQTTALFEPPFPQAEREALTV